MMPLVNLRPFHHRSKECMGIYHSGHAAINTLVKRIPGIKWSKSHGCWYLPISRETYNLVIKALRGKAELDSTALKGYQQKGKSIVPGMPLVGKGIDKISTQRPISTTGRLSAENLLALEKFNEELKLKAYSPSTCRTYRNEFMQLLKLLNEKPVNDLTVDELRRYFVYCLDKLELTEHTLHSRMSGIKFYFEHVLKKEKLFWGIPRPKKPQQLPNLFSQQEVAAIINSLHNKKHKAMVMLAYGAGLRVSEVVSLKTYHIDSRRMTIFIGAAKGKKDRIVGLSPVLLLMLREYAAAYKPQKNGYLFEGNVKGAPYSARTLQEVLQAAKKKVGVLKPGSVHSLRHSFATHLIEKGTDVTMIQRLLGHSDIKTTLIYLHTSNRDLLKVISPLDDLELF